MDDKGCRMPVWIGGRLGLVVLGEALFATRRGDGVLEEFETVTPLLSFLICPSCPAVVGNLLKFVDDVVSDIRVFRVIGDSLFTTFCCPGVAFRPVAIGVDMALLGGVNCDLTEIGCEGDEGDAGVVLILCSDLALLVEAANVELRVRDFSMMFGDGSNCD